MPHRKRKRMVSTLVADCRLSRLFTMTPRQLRITLLMVLIGPAPGPQALGCSVGGGGKKEREKGGRNRLMERQTSASETGIYGSAGHGIGSPWRGSQICQLVHIPDSGQ